MSCSESFIAAGWVVVDAFAALGRWTDTAESMALCGPKR